MTPLTTRGGVRGLPHVLACFGLAWMGTGCAALMKAPATYTPAELRAEVYRRAPGIDPSEVVVPFDVPSEAIDRARSIVSRYTTESQQVRALIEGLLSKRGFGLTYAPIVTTTGAETLASKRGNCLALASAFIGLARALGLHAVYVDASARVTEVSQAAPGLIVNSGHLTAMVEADRRRWYLDFDQTLGPVVNLRVIDDIEALAHFYNNRGFEHVAVSMLDEESVDWDRAARDFQRATAVSPAFARGWNNLGIARARLGKVQEAEAAYKRAIAIDPRSGAPYNNLGSLYLNESRVDLAIKSLQTAVKLEPERAYVHLNLGRAYLRAHDLEAAQRELEKAAAQRDTVARALLGKMALYEEAAQRAAQPN